MQRHTKNYLKFFNFTEADFIPCEICGAEAVDIHHIIPRSKFGAKQKEEQDNIVNIMALCRTCHSVYGQSKLFNEWLSNMHQNYIINRQRLN